MEKNQANKWVVFAYGLPDHATPGQPITGDAANITANVRIDGGAANAVDDTNPTELEAGYYVFDTSAVESNGDLLSIHPVSATPNVQVIGVPGSVYTRPPNFNEMGIESDGDLTQVNSLAGHTAQTADHTAAIADVPTVAEFNARTLAAAAYFDPAADTVANVTTVATTTTNTDMRGTDSAATAANLAIVDTNVDDTLLDTGDIITSVAAIGSTSGGALNIEITSDNTLSPIKGVSFVGVENSGTFASIEADDGVYHEIGDATNAIDIVYQTNVGGTRAGVEIDFKGYLNSANDSITIQAYDFVGATWDTRLTLVGQNGATNVAETIKLLLKHTGTGADLGIVLIRFVNTGQTGPTLFVDELLIAAVNTSNSVGYANGRVFINTGVSNTGTVSFVDGVGDNPVSTTTALKTIADNIGLKGIQILPGSAITLSQAFDAFEFMGFNYSVNLNGQSVNQSSFNGAFIIGNDSGTNPGFLIFKECSMSANTLGKYALLGCVVTDVITLAEEENYVWTNCEGGTAGNAGLDFNSVLNASNVTLSYWSGDLEVQNMGQGTGIYDLKITGNGVITLNANCTGGTLTYAGDIKIIDNSGGAVTIVSGNIGDIIVDTAEIGVAGAGLTDLGGMSTGMQAEINTEADTALTDYDGPTNAEFEARTPTATQLAYIVANAATAVSVTFTTAGGSTTAAVLNLVDEASASNADDQYNGRVLYFTDGTLKGVVTDITDYVGSTKVATITAIPLAPESTHNARLV